MRTGFFRWRRVRITIGIAAAVILVWCGRGTVLNTAGRILVTEDPVKPVDVVFVSNSLPQAAALEAAALFRERVSRRIIMAQGPASGMPARMRALGIPYLDTTELRHAILSRSGVPSTAITVLSGQIDGTNDETQVLAEFIRSQGVASILVITARSHTARTKWLLRRKVRRAATVSVISPRFDTFSASSWWRSRGQSREVVTEYLRWFNTLLLPNFWATR